MEGRSEHMFVVHLAGVPVRRDAVLELAGLLDDSDGREAAPHGLEREARIVALDEDEETRSSRCSPTRRTGSPSFAARSYARTASPKTVLVPRGISWLQVASARPRLSRRLVPAPRQPRPRSRRRATAKPLSRCSQ